MRILKLTLLPLLAALTLSACVVAPVPQQRVVYRDGPPPEAVVEVAPPAPYVEVVPAVPYAGAVWIGGYWGWRGGRHAWVSGRYEAARPGYAWAPHHWEHRPDGHWALRGGGWVRR